MKTLIKGGNIVLEDRILCGDLLIIDGKINKIAADIDQDCDRVYQVDNHYIFAGFIDPHTHMDLQQSEQFKAADDFYSGTRAAALGGTTTIIDHIGFGPAGCALSHSINQYRQIAKSAVIDYGLHGVIQHVDQAILSELVDLVSEAGITSFKAYTTYGYHLSLYHIEQLLHTLKLAGGILTVHCEDHQQTVERTEQLATKGQTAPRYYPLSRPNQVEATAVAGVLAAAKKAGDAPVYIVHTSCRESIEEINAAKRRGQDNIYTETCTQYLLLDQALYMQDDQARAAEYIMAPPLRTQADVMALWQTLARGDISVVATDHCPFMRAEKHLGSEDFRQAPGGIGGVQTRGILMYSEAVHKHGISVVDFSKFMSTNAAKIFGCYPQKGVLAAGSDADIVIIDPAKTTDLSAITSGSNCDYDVYAKGICHGAISHVFSKGACIVQNDRFMGQRGAGQFIIRKPSI